MSRFTRASRPRSLGEQWRFEAFCKAGSRQWGKKLVATFNPLPRRPQYFKRKEDLLFDTDRELRRDVDHILLDNIRGFGSLCDKGLA